MVSCLCPTYRRPKLLKNSIACFEAQDYPADRRELIILDDAGELQNQTGAGWQIISIQRRFRSLPEKFNAPYQQPCDRNGWPSLVETLESPQRLHWPN